MLQADYAERVGRKWFAKGTTYKSISYHEMGHVVMNSHRLSTFKMVEGIECNNILEYAAYHKSESIAKTFSAVYTGERIPEVLTIWDRCCKMLAERRSIT